MSEGELSSKGSKGGNDGAADTHQGTSMAGRFRAPSSPKIDGPAYIPDDDQQVVDEVAKRFRSGPRLGSPVISEAKSLDEEDLGSPIDDISLLDALGAEEPPAEGQFITEASLSIRDSAAEIDREVLPTVEVEPMSAGLGGAPSTVKARVICPSCGAENTEDMSFCVECGGSLDTDAKKAAQQSVVIRDVTRKPPPASAAAKQENPWDISLVCINEDGSDGKSVSLKYLETTMGRDGDQRFPADAFLSPKHARFHVEDGDLYVEDLYSLNGTFIKLREETRLTPGDTILMGRQVLRFERFEQSITPKTKSSDGTRYMGSPAPGGSFKVLQVGIGGIVQNVYCLPEAGAVLGREKGDIVFPHDKFMSGRHAQIYTGDDGQSYLVDLNSSNGTWIKIWEKTKLEENDFMFMGQQLFRVKFY